MIRKTLVTTFALLTALTFTPAVQAGTGLITTYAGGGSGDVGGPATNLALNNPQFPAFDASGNLFFLDAGNYRVIRVDGVSGMATLFAGNGQYGYSGDGGPATQASIGVGPIAVDPSGNVFIADNYGNRVRRVDGQTGIITTAVGTGAASSTGDNGPASAATINYPMGLAFDQFGDLFVSEQSGNRIRCILRGTGTIFTVAGNGYYGYSGDGGMATSASMSGPNGLAVDSSGSVYFADVLNHRIRRVDGQTGIITTVVGSGGATYEGDQISATNNGIGPAEWIGLDNSGNLYLQMFGEVRILRVALSTGALTTIAGTGISSETGDGGPATAATFGVANQIAVAPNGDVVVADTTSNRIRRISLPSPLTYSVSSFGAPAGPLTPTTPLSAAVLAYTGSGTPTGTVSFYDNNRLFQTATLNGGTAGSFTLASLGGGNHSLRILYSGDSNFNPSSTPAWNFTATATSVALTSSLNPVNPGSAVTLSAVLSPQSDGNGHAPSGTLSFYDGSTLLGSAAVASGGASISATFSTSGSHSLTVSYSGDFYFGSSSSSVFTENVNSSAGPTTTTTALSTNPVNNPWGPNWSNLYTVAISPASDANGHQPTGSITLYDGSTAIASTSVTGATTYVNATLTTLGSHNLTAVYGGDANFASSTSAVFVEVIKTPATPTISADVNPVTAGATVNFTATILQSAATGTVQLVEYPTPGATPNVLASATLANAKAVFPMSTLSVGSHNIGVNYLGDSTYLGASSSYMVETVRAVTTIALSASSNSPIYGQSVTFTAAVTPGTATGTVQFMDGANSLGTATLSSGAASLAVSSLAAGSHSISAVYSGDSGNAGSTSAALNETVTPATTTIALASSQNPVPSSQSLALTATVSPAAAPGSVQFLDGTTVLATVALSNGVATYAASLAIGSHSLTAAYVASANYSASTSSVIAELATTTTTTTLTASPASSTYGQSVQLTAAVSPAPASGSVQFLDGATVLGTSAMGSGGASFTVSTLTPGSHSLTAIYSGDGAAYLGSTSAAIAETVGKAAASVSLNSSVNPANAGQSITFNVSVTPGAATGTVQFFDGSTSLGTATVASGAASLSLSALAAGQHSITAVYSGDNNYSAVTSAALNQVVKAGTTTTVQSSNASVAYGQPVTFTAAVSPSTATGSVQFLDGAISLGTATLAGGSASFSLSNLGVGPHSITAIYGGDSNNIGSASAVLTQTITRITATISLTASPNPSATSQTVTLAAAVSPSSASGTVQFYDGATSLGTATLSGGAASLSIATLAAGSHSLTAVYSGDTNDNSATSGAVTEVVKASTTTTLSASPAAVTYPSGVKLSAAVTPATATGTIQFFDGATSLGTVALNGGASLTLSLAAGSHTITAAYSGDANDTAGTSSGVAVTVSKAATTTTLASSLNPSTAGQAVTFTATVSPSTATGTVTFQDGSTTLGTVNLASGSAAYSTSSLGAASHTITATYSGDANDAGSSGTLTQTVKATLPGAPSALTATAASSSQINLTWTASSTSGVTYNVYSSTTSGFTPSSSNKIASGLTATSYSHTGLSANTTHYYVVTAQNSVGESSPSNQANATTQAAGVSCHVVYTVTTQWNVGFGTAITIQNTGSTPINGWTLSWTWPGNQQITQSWNGNYTQSGANASLTNASWNSTISPGSTLSGMGFNGSYSGANNPPTAFYVNGALCH